MRAELIIVENEAEHREARALVHALMLAERPEDVARLRAQALLIADWEAKRYPPPPPDPIEAIRFRIEQLGLTPREVAAIFGARSRASEVLSGKRGLSLAMIRRAHRALGIPLDVLIGALDEGEDPSRGSEAKPAVPIDESVQPDHIVCLEDGRKLRMLKRHLKAAYGMTPDEYRTKWGLPADYPMVAPGYAKRRSNRVKATGPARSSPGARRRA